MAQRLTNQPGLGIYRIIAPEGGAGEWRSVQVPVNLRLDQAEIVLCVGSPILTRAIAVARCRTAA